ncbi:MAG: hypothetical protein JST22_13310 [Bacteroidetes bacterium]|nr:hypothetical protein [Bacteroidota bacterium]
MKTQWIPALLAGALLLGPDAAATAKPVMIHRIVRPHTMAVHRINLAVSVAGMNLLRSTARAILRSLPAVMAPVPPAAALPAGAAVVRADRPRLPEKRAVARRVKPAAVRSGKRVRARRRRLRRVGAVKHAAR